MKILVVGGAGYIGGALTDLLMEKNYSVRVYEMRSCMKNRIASQWISFLETSTTMRSGSRQDA